MQKIARAADSVIRIGRLTNGRSRRVIVEFGITAGVRAEAAGDAAHNATTETAADSATSVAAASIAAAAATRTFGHAAVGTAIAAIMSCFTAWQ